MDEFRVMGHIAKKIVDLRQDQTTFLAGGGAKDFAEYRHVCGVIRGLNHAEAIVDDLVQRLEKSDDAI
jgi:hypothetical protein